MDSDLSIAPAPSGKLTWADTAGMLASVGCAIHCAAMPIIIGYLPAIGFEWLAGAGFHRWMAIICSVLAGAAFLPAWRKHRKLAPVLLGMVGIALLASHAFGSEANCCLAEQCDACVKASDSIEAASAALVQASSDADVPSLTARLSPWLTPIGGLVLVVAHLVNHRLSCQCCRGEQACWEDE